MSVAGSDNSWGTLPPVQRPETITGDRLAVGHAYGKKPEYVYLSAELFSDKPIAELPLSGVTFEWAINGPGKLSATLNIGSFAPARDYFKATVPGKTVVYIIRDGKPLWGGIIWKRSFSSTARSVTIEAETWDSYMFHRILRDNINIQRDPDGHLYNRILLGMDQLEIFRQMWKFMSSGENSDIGVIIDQELSGVMKGVSFDGSQYISYGEHMKKFATPEEKTKGFEWYATVGLSADNGKIERRIELKHPKFGRSWAETGMIWEYPGNIITYSWVGDVGSDHAATVALVSGEGDGENQAWVSKKNVEAFNNGYPRLDRHWGHKRVADKNVLRSHANKYLQAFSPPTHEISIETHPSTPYYLGQYFIGDEILMMINDDFYKFSDVDERDRVARVKTLSVTVADDGSEQIKPSLELLSQYFEIIDPEESGVDLVGEGWNGLTISPPDVFPVAPAEPEVRKRAKTRRDAARLNPAAAGGQRGLEGLANALRYGDDPWNGSKP